MGAIVVIVLLIILNTYLRKLEKADAIKKDSVSGEFDDYENECHEDSNGCECDGFHQDCDCD